MPRRYAIITGGASSLEHVRAYMPDNYKAQFDVHFFADYGAEKPDYQPIQVITIEGEDSGSWTLDGYVIPRLASGLIFAREEKI